MRIQHNITAMNSYRNYSNNVSSLAKNLEKLSSGYKINRAGDDAAGLAISEKMRAQITGLEMAQKNAKDGISLVQTAEGALTEVHDMLNRMYELAEQSANGTYDNEVDRVQLQKEIDSLSTEINRIADSANFNGIKLLDGSLEEGKVTLTTIDAAYDSVSSDLLWQKLGFAATAASPVLGTNTIFEKTSDGDGRPSFEVDLEGIGFGVSGTSDTFSIQIGNDAAVTATVGGQKGQFVEAETLAKSFVGQQVSVDGITFTATAEGTKVIFKADTVPTTSINAHHNISITSSLGAAGTFSAGTVGSFAVGFTAGALSASSDTAQQAISNNLTIAVTVAIAGTVVTFTAASISNISSAVDVIDALGAATATVDGSALKLDLNGDGTVDGNDTLTFKFSDLFTGSFSGGTLTFKQAEGHQGDNVFLPFNPLDQLAGKIGGITLTGGGVGPGTTATLGSTKVSVTGTDSLNVGILNYDENITKLPTIDTGSINIVSTEAGDGNVLANTNISLKGLIEDGAKLKLGDQEYIFAVGKNSKFKGAANVVDLTDMESNDTKLLETGVSRLTQVAKDNTIFSVGHGTTAGDVRLQQKLAAKDSTDMSDKESLLQYFGYSSVKEGSEVTVTQGSAVGKPLTLQIGDTADTFNKLEVSINDMHVDAMGIGDISVLKQDGAADAMAKIKDAINYVSNTRGTLGATQNRLDHTINNLSVMQENIQDAESTIRDVDVAKEMMEYTKNNILVQSAQAMLAQANQLPQGVLQLLG